MGQALTHLLTCSSLANQPKGHDKIPNSNKRKQSLKDYDIDLVIKSIPSRTLEEFHRLTSNSKLSNTQAQAQAQAESIRHNENIQSITSLHNNTFIDNLSKSTYDLSPNISNNDNNWKKIQIDSEETVNRASAWPNNQKNFNTKNPLPVKINSSDEFTYVKTSHK